jgi:hypothetical protein
MLVCSVSMRPPRRAIAAELAEATAAADASTTGQVVFATLVDDPASVGDTVDAYLGEIMLEAAAATDTSTAGSIYVAALDEAVTTADTPDATIISAIPVRDAMVMDVFVNSTTSREAHVNGTMVNL